MFGSILPQRKNAAIRHFLVTEMKTNDAKRIHCPVEITLEVLGGKWKTVILWHLRQDAQNAHATIAGFGA